jgi:hypothetical protein
MNVPAVQHRPVLVRPQGRPVLQLRGFQVRRERSDPRALESIL